MARIIGVTPPSAPATGVAPPVAAAAAPAAPTAAEGNVLIARMHAKADLTAVAEMPRGADRKQATYDALVKTATDSQKPALDALAALQEKGLVTKVESMFLPNAIVVTTAKNAGSAVTDALKGIADIQGVSENKQWGVSDGGGGAPAIAAAAGNPKPQVPAGTVDAIAASATPEWGVAKIGAPAAWASGIDGKGVTIGIVDTGLDSQHPAIKAHYRGTQADGSQVNDYNWFDPFTHADKPFDDGEHGTHVAGTAAGGSETKATGVAPGAKIIAAKAILSSGYNTTEGTLKALQFMLAPTKTDGTDPNPKVGADVVNNSWGNADLDDATFRDTFDGLKAAGIEVVTAAGNDGPMGKISPPGSYPGFFSVAASTNRDTVASFSSRGPSKFAPDDVLPNLTAPGQGITSSVPGGGYQNMSGTSMASPHMAGAVALMLEAKPQATHDEMMEAFKATATDIDKPGPDTAAGYGRINVDKAIEYLQSH